MSSASAPAQRVDGEFTVVPRHRPAEHPVQVLKLRGESGFEFFQGQVEQSGQQDLHTGLHRSHSLRLVVSNSFKSFDMSPLASMDSTWAFSNCSCFLFFSRTS